MKPAKREISLNERDALRDQLAAERMLMGAYAEAVAEGSTAALRKKLFQLYGEHAQTQLGIMEQMLSRGYAASKPASQELIGQSAEGFSKARKELAAKNGA